MKFDDVKTYLNSGNVIFSTDELDTKLLKQKIENMLEKQFAFDIPVVILEKETLNDLLTHAPDWWGNEDKDIYDNLIFLIPPANYSDVSLKLGPPKDDLEKIEVYKNTIFWSFVRKECRKTNWWSKTANPNIASHLTIRTANTIRKIVEM